MTHLAPDPVSRRVGNTGMAVYPVAVDGSVFGWATDEAAAAGVLDSFTDAGGNLISTADHYAGGRSEVMIGAWLRRYQRRENLVISTRVGRHPDAPGRSAAAIRSAVEASLSRLGSECIDLLSLDGRDTETPLEESITAVAELIAEGKVGYLATAGFPAERLREAIRIASRLELESVSGVIATYNLLDREPYETEISPIAIANGLGVLARLPLARGYLRGQEVTVPLPLPGEPTRKIGRHGERVIAALEDLAWQHDTTVGCVALAWVLSKPMVVAPIVRALDADGLLSCLPAARLELTMDEIDRLDRISAR